MKLKIEYVPIDSIVPYEGNAKLHPPAQIEQIKRSMEEFGNIDPIGVWHGEIVEGHGWHIAAKELGYKEIPIIRLDDLTDEQRRAYTLVHNKLTMNSGFDLDILIDELEDIDMDMEQFGFDIDMDDDDGYFGDERERTYNSVNLNEYDETRTEGYYQMPVLERCDFVPDRLIGFKYTKAAKDEDIGDDIGVHFFIDDYQFERIWNQPHVIIPRLAVYGCVLTPDFSLYMDMPRAMKVWNVYRSRLIGQMMQDEGYEVIPTLQWAEKETFDFCFDGLPQGGTVAVSSVGVVKDEDAVEIWEAGMREALDRLKPKTVLYYGSRIDFDFGCEVRYYDSNKRNGWGAVYGQ